MTRSRDTGNVGYVASRKNLIINGDFSVWQRGTSQTAGGYNSVDRFFTSIAGSTDTLSQVAFTLGQTDVTGNPKFYTRNAVTTSAGAGNLALFSHKVENVEVSSSKEVTLSFWAKADAGKNLATEFTQNFGTGGSPSSQVSSLGVTTHTLTTSWQKFTVTVTLPSISGKTLGTDGNDYTGLVFWLDAGSTYDARTNSLGQQSGTFDISNVQLEFGDNATEFEYVEPADQLARCQRYAFRPAANNAALFNNFGHGTAISTTVTKIVSELPVTMRDVPTITVSNPTSFNISDSVTATAVTTVALDTNVSSVDRVVLTASTASGLTQYRAYNLESNNSLLPTIVYDAEL